MAWHSTLGEILARWLFERLFWELYVQLYFQELGRCVFRKLAQSSLRPLLLRGRKILTGEPSSRDLPTGMEATWSPSVKRLTQTVQKVCLRRNGWRLRERKKMKRIWPFWTAAGWELNLRIQNVSNETELSSPWNLPKRLKAISYAIFSASQSGVFARMRVRVVVGSIQAIYFSTFCLSYVHHFLLLLQTVTNLINAL